MKQCTAALKESCNFVLILSNAVQRERA